MKFKNTLVMLGFSAFITTSLQAQDFPQEKRDLTIMSGIFQSVMQEDMPDDIPGVIPSIEMLYLADQGMVFTMTLPRAAGNYLIMSDYTISTAPETSAVVVEAGSMEINQAFSPTYTNLVQARAERDELRAQATRELMEVQDRVQELQAKMRELQRSELEHQAERMRETEAELEAVMKNLEEQREERDRIVMETRAIQAEARIRQRDMIVDSMTSTLCDYGSTLRSLEPDQFVTLQFKNYGDESSRVMMFVGRDISSCDDVETLMEKGVIYDI